MVRLFLLLVFALVLGGCPAKRDYYPPESYGYYDSFGDVVMAESSGMRKSKSGRGAGGGRMPPPPPPMPSGSVDMAPEAPEPEPQAPEKQTRMVHYNGWASIQVTRVDELLDQVSTMAKDNGGFVERLGDDYVTVRIPVDVFFDVWEEVLALGGVLDKSLTAEDVTEAFMAIDLRLRTARTTRDRLNDLLAKAEEEEEKIRLLKEIQRLTEQIDRFESQLRVVGELAAFSRLTVQGVARQAFSNRSASNEVTGFGWIRQLSPWRRDVAASGKLLKLAVPEGLVALDEKKRFIAESPDGVVIWSGRLDNEPEGDASFWIDAIERRVSDEFASAEVLDIGGYRVLRLVDPGDPEGYRYLIGIRIVGKYLDLVEVYYPGADQEVRYDAAILAALEGGVS
ncbi:MAG: DUF4349 domain-containing protein [Proteobacteria bacterium]|jgi:hypothetical protein|nr:DUF4349 domain-containing protein [Pseudomonadota bacterium]